MAPEESLLWVREHTEPRGASPCSVHRRGLSVSSASGTCWLRLWQCRTTMVTTEKQGRDGVKPLYHKWTSLGVRSLPVMAAPGSLRQEDRHFEASLNHLGKPYFKIKKGLGCSSEEEHPWIQSPVRSKPNKTKPMEEKRPRAPGWRSRAHSLWANAVRSSPRNRVGLFLFFKMLL